MSLDDLRTKVRSKELTKSSEPLHIAHRGQNESSDLIGVLLHRGEKLREAMVMSADEANDEDEAGGASVVFDRFVHNTVFKSQSTFWLLSVMSVMFKNFPFLSQRQCHQ